VASRLTAAFFHPRRARRTQAKLAASMKRVLLRHKECTTNEFLYWRGLVPGATPGIHVSPITSAALRETIRRAARLNGSQAVATIACRAVSNMSSSEPGMAAGLKVTSGLRRQAAGAPDLDSGSLQLWRSEGLPLRAIPLMPSASPRLGVCLAGWDLDVSRHPRLAP
jgi:hypothetical protein